MWCSNCQQDVPAIATPEDGKVRCTKCRCDIAIRSQGRADRPAPAPPVAKIEERLPDTDARTEPLTSEVPAWAFVERSPIDLDAWRWDPDLLAAERMLKAFGPSSAEKAFSTVPGETRIDPPHATANEYRQPDRRRESAESSSAAIAISVGVMAIVGGGLLLGWGLLTAQHSFWPFATFCLISGEGGVIAGLLLRLARVSRSQRAASTTLLELDSQIEDLRRATSWLNRSHGGFAPSFYTHVAKGASSRMHLADLKSQVDRLAMRLTDSDRMERR